MNLTNLKLNNRTDFNSLTCSLDISNDVANSAEQIKTAISRPVSQPWQLCDNRTGLKSNELLKNHIYKNKTYIANESIYTTNNVYKTKTDKKANIEETTTKTETTTIATVIVIISSSSSISTGTSGTGTITSIAIITVGSVITTGGISTSGTITSCVVISEKLNFIPFDSVHRKKKNPEVSFFSVPINFFLSVYNSNSIPFLLFCQNKKEGKEIERKRNRELNLIKKSSVGTFLRWNEGESNLKINKLKKREISFLNFRIQGSVDFRKEIKNLKNKKRKENKLGMSSLLTFCSVTRNILFLNLKSERLKIKNKKDNNSGNPVQGFFPHLLDLRVPNLFSKKEKNLLKNKTNNKLVKTSTCLVSVETFLNNNQFNIKNPGYLSV